MWSLNTSWWWLTSTFWCKLVGTKQARVARTKWWKLEREESKVFKEKVIEEGPWNDKGDANSMWEKIATCVRKVASEVLGVTKGSGCDPKDTWFF